VVGAAAGQGAGRGDHLALTGARLGPEFAKLWTASTVSNLGDGITVVAGPLLAASLTRNPLLVAARLLGRVNGAYAVFSYGGASLGALLGGMLAGRFGLTAPFWCGFVAVAILALAAWPTLSSGRVRAARERAAADA
jgi:MFS family permease